jgi:drug/metabolite transporter (DMT)-like permease
VQKGYPSLSTTLWGLTGSAVVLVPVMAWTIGRTGWPSAGPAAWGSILVLALLTSVVGYVAWYWALARGGIARVAGVQFTQPLFGLLLAAIVLGERPGPTTLVAGAAILAGMWMVQRASSTAVPD